MESLAKAVAWREFCILKKFLDDIEVSWIKANPVCFLTIITINLVWMEEKLQKLLTFHLQAKNGFKIMYTQV